MAPHAGAGADGVAGRAVRARGERRCMRSAGEAVEPKPRVFDRQVSTRLRPVQPCVSFVVRERRGYRDELVSNRSPLGPAVVGRLRTQLRPAAFAA